MVIKITESWYYELEKPNEEDYYCGDKNGLSFEERFSDDMKEYEASKREVEVSNAIFGKIAKKWFVEFGNFNNKLIQDFQHCEAEITDGKATIAKIL